MRKSKFWLKQSNSKVNEEDYIATVWANTNNSTIGC